MENGIEPFCKLVQGHLQKFCLLVGECHVEQVQVVYDVLQVFFLIIAFINGTSHLAAEIDGNQREGVEGSFGRLAP